MFGSAASKPSGFSFGSNQQQNSDSNQQKRPSSFSFGGPTKPGLFGNSQTTGNTTANALNGFGGTNSGTSLGGATQTAGSGFSFGNSTSQSTSAIAPGQATANLSGNNKPAGGLSIGLNTQGSSLNPTGGSFFGGSGQAPTQVTSSNLFGSTQQGIGQQQQQQQQVNSNPYGFSINSTSKDIAMPKALTSSERKPSISSAHIKRKRSSSSVAQDQANLKGSLSLLSKITNSLKIPNKYSLESVSGIFSQSSTDESENKETNAFPARKRQTPSSGLNRSSNSQSQFRRLIIRNPTGTHKSYQDIDPNEVLLRRGNVSVPNKPTTLISSLKPKALKVAGEVPSKAADETTCSTSEQTGDLIPKDYWCSPSVDDLSHMTTSELTRVEGFTVGRYGFGQVSFQYPVDLTSFHGEWSLLLGKCIQFKSRLLLVYPDGFEKPSIGNGLNVPATVVIEKCFPIDKSTKEPVTDPNSQEMIDFVKKMKEIKGMQFLNYEPTTGSYTFSVQHFSIWGLVDEEADDPDLVAKFKKQQQDEFHNDKRRSELQTNTLEKLSKSQNGDVDESMSEVFSNSTYDEDNFIYKRQKPEVIIPGGWNYTPIKKQNGDAKREVVEKKKSPVSIEEQGQSVSQPIRATRRASLNFDELVKPKPYEPEVEDVDMLALTSASEYPTSKNWDEQVALADGFYSVFNSDLYKAKALQLDSKNVNKYLFSENDGSKYKKVDNGPVPVFQHKREIQSIIIGDIARTDFTTRTGNNYPKVNFDENVSLVLTLSEFQNVDDYQLWELLAILFDDDFCLSFLSKRDEKVAQLKSAVRHRLLDLKRRDLLINWLTQYNAKDQEKRLVLNKADPLEHIFTLLCANNLSAALQKAFETSNHNLAILIAMIDSNDETVQTMAKNQLSEWYKSSTLKLIPIPILKIYKLLSGSVLSKEFVSHLDGLSWVTVLFLTLKYGDSSKSLPSLISEFLNFSKVNFPSESSEYYRLFNIFTQPLDVVKGFSIEYQYLMLKKLQPFLSLGSSIADKILLSFASKLKSFNEFNESIYVLSHLSSDEKCKTEIFKVLNDHIDELGFLNDDSKLLQLHRIF
ncbi:unnamed protein product [Ambrosiozyma monospora]|uniref:Unnamed protein product n=1 Tax=Ambrosiozyma monospora TaxID=43982 RepID=A0A9W6YYQ7_AMBMO|nr:unnamed protein product [Ambrosiozyma monospora]